MKNKLVISPITAALLLVICAVAASAKFQALRWSSSLKEGVEPWVKVEILGAVKKPGIYSFPVGTLVKEVLKKAEPRPFADLSKVDLRAALHEDVSLVLAELSELKVTLKQDSAETVIAMPLGSRVCDLKKKLGKKNALSSHFMSRRKLKNGETFELRNKGLEENCPN